VPSYAIAPFTAPPESYVHIVLPSRARSEKTLPASDPKMTRPLITSGDDSERLPIDLRQRTLPFLALSEVTFPDRVTMNSWPPAYAGEDAFSLPTLRFQISLPFFARSASAVPSFLTR